MVRRVPSLFASLRVQKLSSGMKEITTVVRVVFLPIYSLLK
jgi:hypothetical protein